MCTLPNNGDGGSNAIPLCGRSILKGHNVNDRPIIAVTCLSFEAQVAAGPGVSVLCGAARRNIHKPEAAAEAGGTPIISFGIAGGLAPGMSRGDLVVASGVITDG